MFRRFVIGAAVVGLAATGCSGDKKDAAPAPPAPGTPVAQDAATTWAASVCTAVTSGSLKLNMPQLDAKDPAKSQQGIVTFLVDLSGQLKTLNTNLTAAGKPPVQGADKAYATAIDNLKKSQIGVDAAAAQLRKAKVTNAKGLEAALGNVSTVMTKLGTYQGPTNDLITNPQLKAAFAKAPACANVVPK